MTPRSLRSRYSAWNLLAVSFSGHADWAPSWREAEPQHRYDMVIVSGGGHGLATANGLEARTGNGWPSLRFDVATLATV